MICPYQHVLNVTIHNSAPAVLFLSCLLNHCKCGRDIWSRVTFIFLAVLLAATALVTIATAGKILWIGLSHWTVAAQTLKVLNELLIVLMLVEILHTVRISIRSHVLVTEPFLVVGLIASIRRILVVTLEAATLTKEGAWTTEGASGIFRSSMVELGLLGLLVLVLVVSITILRRYAPTSKDLPEI